MWLHACQSYIIMIVAYSPRASSSWALFSSADRDALQFPWAMAGSATYGPVTQMYAVALVSELLQVLPRLCSCTIVHQRSLAKSCQLRRHRLPAQFSATVGLASTHQRSISAAEAASGGSATQ